MLRAITILTAVVALCCGPGASTVHAQRGTGDDEGVARQAALPEIVVLKGIIQEVESGPCENTTGRATIGTHVLIETSGGETLNVHLGPKEEVAQIAGPLEPDKPITIRAFRTERMAEHHYVAQVLKSGKQTVRLRDESLRPFWAGGRGTVSGRRGQRSDTRRYPPGMGVGAAYGTCPVWGGPPQGRGRAGAAWGGGRGQRQGPALGPARGNGQGRGQAMRAQRGGGRGQGMGRQGGGRGYRHRHRSGR